ncbi:MAG: hypothetical protein HY909_22200 [Deltaproteobacteria bacterium]|nr:hypothetical protein [Deltaproteobacteria bacterium]
MRCFALLAFALAVPSELLAQPVVLPGTQPGGLTARLEPAAQCLDCHSMSTTPDGRLYLPNDTWAPSMMANAARDPLFLATLQVANAQVPDLGQYCLRCHTPAGFVGGRALPGTGERLDPLQDLDGVHCDACHRSLDPRAQTPPVALGNAQYVLGDAPPMGRGPVRFGPYDDPFPSPRHTSMSSPFIRDAALCGQCHDVDNPLARRLSMTGMDTGLPFPLQSTYTEWRQSSFARGGASARTCQQCHMAEEPGMLPVTRIPGAPARPDPRRHDFHGANEWGTELLRVAYPGEFDDDVMRQARMRQQAFLRTAATLTLSGAPSEARAGSSVRLTVRVTNRSGHKLPTGYEDARLLFLQVQRGAAVVSGLFEGDELVEDRARDAQLRVFRFQAGRFEGGRVTPSDFVARHNVVLEDTRIPAEGMLPDARTQPVGRDYAGGAGGALRHYDDAVYDIPIPAGTPNGPLTLTVRLLYQTTTKHYVNTIADATMGHERGRRLRDAWNMSGRAAPFAIATATATVTITGGAAPVDAGPDAALDAALDGPSRDGPSADAAPDAALDGPSRDGATALDGPPPPSTPPTCQCRGAGSGPGGSGALVFTTMLALAGRRRKRHTPT